MSNTFRSITEAYRSIFNPLRTASYRIVQGGGNSLVEAIRNNHTDFSIEYDEDAVIAKSSDFDRLDETAVDAERYDSELKQSDPYAEYRANPSEGGHGGIIVFSTDVNSKQLDANRLMNWLKQKLTTVGNRLAATRKLDRIRRKFDVYAWTIGRFFKGVYTGDNGKTFSENSLSVEILLIDRKKLFDIAEAIKSDFEQESVLVKDYSNGQTYFV